MPYTLQRTHFKGLCPSEGVGHRDAHFRLEFTLSHSAQNDALEATLSHSAQAQRSGVRREKFKAQKERDINA